MRRARWRACGRSRTPGSWPASAPPRSSPTRRCTGSLEAGVVGRTEREVAIELELRMRRLGAEAAELPVDRRRRRPRRAAARRAAREPIPARRAADDRLGRAATTATARTAPAPTRPARASPTQAREVYALRARAPSDAGLAAVRPGPSGREVDAAARAVIERAGHGEHFGHGLGHGVGLEIHEGPRLSRNGGDEPLRAGNVVTVEPGVYLPGGSACGSRTSSHSEGRRSASSPRSPRS